MKYKAGDIVKIRDDLIPGEEYGDVTILPHFMASYIIGNTFRIKCVSNEKNYSIGMYYVSEEMIERRIIPMDILRIENRIAKLKAHPVENANLIEKWERKLRKVKQEVA